MNSQRAFLSGLPLRLCCHRHGCQQVEVGLIGRLPVKRRMRTAAIVEADIATDRGSSLEDVGVRPQIHLFVFDSTPKPLHEDIVPPGPFAVHADLYLPVGQHLDELDRRELAALIRVEDFGSAMPRECLLDGLDAEVGLQGDRHAPGKHPPSEPVHDSREIDEATRHGASVVRTFGAPLSVDYGRVGLVCGMMLCGELAVLQAPIFEGLSFDPFTLF